MRTRSSAQKLTPWKQILRLGEHLLETSSLAGQRDRLVSAAETLFGGRADLWLDESLFRLPGLNQDPLFPPQPADEFMRRAYEAGEPCCQDDAPAKAAAVPLRHKNLHWVFCASNGLAARHSAKPTWSCWMALPVTPPWP
ncbi:MAG: hypothetical protein KJ606_13415 [Chloroflexi bacterium]|nr:hypothetical protein [Chloroflexota bacterium]